MFDAGLHTGSDQSGVAVYSKFRFALRDREDTIFEGERTWNNQRTKNLLPIIDIHAKHLMSRSTNSLFSSWTRDLSSLLGAIGTAPAQRAVGLAKPILASRIDKPRRLFLAS
jgi:hypothetical protein